MDVKRKKSGFTIVELLTTLAIIAMLVGLLIPSLTLIRNTAKEAKQKAQLTTIGLALMTFKNDSDYDDYPPSVWPDLNPLPEPPTTDYCGAQKLAEALLGWDLLGFHPKSAWRADGLDGGLSPEGWLTYDPLKTRDVEPIGAPDDVPDTLNERRGPYLERATANAFRLGISAPGNQDGLFDLFRIPSTLAPDTFVICDVFGVKKITLIQPGPAGKTDVFKAGTPILYYRANTSRKTIEPPAKPFERIYNCLDNQALISLKRLPDQIKDHRLGDQTNVFQFFYAEYIRDPKITAKPWPYRPDSYILISAGVDGEYGTDDDIRNFGN